jgi:hypothetical protein
MKTNILKLLAKILSFTGLCLTLIPSFFVMSNSIEPDSARQLMILGTVMWFILAPFWMDKKTVESK